MWTFGPTFCREPKVVASHLDKHACLQSEIVFVPVDYRVLCDSGNIEYLQLVVAPLLSVIHIYSVCEEMRAAPVNTLNPQRTAMIVADFVKVHIQCCKDELHQFFTSQLTKFFFYNILDWQNLKSC